MTDGFYLPCLPRSRARARGFGRKIEQRHGAAHNLEDSMQAREASTRDARFISHVVVSSWRDAYGSFLPQSLLASLDHNPHHDSLSWERRLCEPGAVTWILADEVNNDVGVLRITAGGSSVPGTDGELTTLYVLSRARGRGLGSQATVFARAQARRRGVRVLGFCLLADNKRGRRFYERLGARQIGRRIAFRWEDQPIIELLYRFE
jgi:ribosomal protein S18 acetylase RimI-like enzyme